MIETGEIKQFIKRAEESVKDVSDEKLKIKAFEVVLNNLVKSSIEKKFIPCSEKPKPKDAVDISVGKLNKDNLLNALNISDNQLNNFVDFDEDDFRILSHIQDKSETKKQQQATLIILTIKYYCYGDREINTSELKNKLKDMGIKSLENMAANLKDFENYIIKKGKQRSPATVYRITDPGIKEGLRLITELGANYE
ncbi:MAG: hypothetical protein O8C67_09500 [Candidatus Methanoperedens sp.]|nr:hypothetical protein [Candidatus Methanoperedens sp.]MCZ7405149.1 hypothetical protein [Candidatus Methanoperedens sp.]